MISEPIAGLNSVNTIAKMWGEDRSAQNAITDLIQTALAEELGLASREPFNLIPINQLLGVAEEDHGLDLVLDALRQVLDGAVVDRAALGVAARDDL